MRIFKKNTAPDNHYENLKDDLRKTTIELKTAYTNFQNVSDPDLIDYYIYQTKAVQIRYKYLLECVKKLEDSYAKNPL